MPPKVRITKEAVVDTALELVRIGGESAMNARSIAARLGCSTQPIFSNFESMEQLRRSVIQRAMELFIEYMGREIESGALPPYKATGIAYIRFAGEERELFKLLFMRDRSGEREEFGEDPVSNIAMDCLKAGSGLGDDQAAAFHREMWIFVHGIATMAATAFMEFDIIAISAMMSKVYNGLMSQYKGEQYR